MTVSGVCPFVILQEEVSFMAFIARCMAAGRPSARSAAAGIIPERFENLFQNAGAGALSMSTA